jgi:hypothetical protein
MTPERVGLSVACYAGSRADEEPRHFVFDGRAVEVHKILDRWVDPIHRCFRVCGADGVVYTLRQESATGRWSLTN